MTRKVAYYISDHGLGHATRSIALIRELKKNGVKVLVKNYAARRFLSLSLQELPIYSKKTDVGPVVNEDFSVNTKATEARFKSWYSERNVKQWIKQEQEFLSNQGINLVISDISPLPLQASHNCGITSIGVSNFTWCDILAKLDLCDIKLVDSISSIYEFADACIELPFSLELKGMRNKCKAELLVRSVSETRLATRKYFHVAKDDYLIFITSGKSAQFSKRIAIKCSEPYILVLSSGLRDVSKGRLIPCNYTETQNVVAASDLVVSKGGYGIFSECVQECCPLYMIPRRGIVEDAVYTSEIRKMHLGKVIRFSELANLSIPTLKEVKSMKQHSRNNYTNGNERVVEAVLQYIYR
jgi:hypothetical protein